MKSHHPAPWAIYGDPDKGRLYVCDADGHEVGLQAEGVYAIPNWMRNAVEGVNHPAPMNGGDLVRRYFNDTLPQKEPVQALSTTE